MILLMVTVLLLPPQYLYSAGDRGTGHPGFSGVWTIQSQALDGQILDRSNWNLNATKPTFRDLLESLGQQPRVQGSAAAGEQPQSPTQVSKQPLSLRDTGPLSSALIQNPPSAPIQTPHSSGLIQNLLSQPRIQEVPATTAKMESSPSSDTGSSSSFARVESPSARVAGVSTSARGQGIPSSSIRVQGLQSEARSQELSSPSSNLSPDLSSSTKYSLFNRQVSIQQPASDPQQASEVVKGRPQQPIDLDIVLRPSSLFDHQGSNTVRANILENHFPWLFIENHHAPGEPGSHEEMRSGESRVVASVEHPPSGVLPAADWTSGDFIPSRVYAAVDLSANIGADRISSRADDEAVVVAAGSQLDELLAVPPLTQAEIEENLEGHEFLREILGLLNNDVHVKRIVLLKENIKEKVALSRAEKLRQESLRLTNLGIGLHKQKQILDQMHHRPRAERINVSEDLQAAAPPPANENIRKLLQERAQLQAMMNKLIEAAIREQEYQTLRQVLSHQEASLSSSQST